MKSYKNLYEQCISDDNIRKAISKATLGKRHKKNAKELYENMEKYIDSFKDLSKYNCKKYETRFIYDGISKKQSEIMVPDLYDQVTHHMIIQTLEPILLKGVYEHAYGSIPGRSVHDAKRTLSKWIQKDPLNTKYVLKCDIKKFFQTIPHNKIKLHFCEIIKDKKMLNIINSIIDVNRFNYHIGLPLGFYTSQWFSMWYLKDFDHFVKERLNIKHYMRYMDDIVILSDTKEELIYALRVIKKCLNYYGLKLNEKTQIFPLSSRPIDFMGYKFYPNRTTLRKKLLYKIRRKVNKIKKKDTPTIHDYRQMISYMGWIKDSQIYNYWLKYLKSYFNFKKAKQVISLTDKTINKRRLAA